MALKQIQVRVGTKDDGIFGKGTAKAIAQHLKLTNTQAAHFLGQCLHESGGFKIVEESFRYSQERLLQVFPRYFDAVQAKYYVGKPQAIASRVYGNRMGNDVELSGEGWKYRGRGIIQLTGKNNYLEFSKAVNEPRIMIEPDLVATEYALDSAKWFFDRNRIWRYCDVVSDASILTVSRAVNVGNPNSSITPHGMDDRLNETKKVFKWLTE